MTQTFSFSSAEIPFPQVGGFQVGHAQHDDALTGCTVLLFDSCTPAGVDVRGGGPASRETTLLHPLADAQGLHALLLCGGSAFGLDAAAGVMSYLENHNIGFDVGITRVPLVCASALFDLGIGLSHIRPDGAMAYEACKQASPTENRQGNVGAGTGCTVGKYWGMERSMKSGLGTYALQIGEVKIGALVAVNALGDIFDIDTALPLAGLRDPSGKKRSSTEQEFLRDISGKKNLFTGNTTLGVIVTNGAFSKSELTKIAGMAHNGYARCIRPVHTTADGDSIYALSTGNVLADINVVGSLASYVMGKAIANAVLHARCAGGIPSLHDLEK